MVMTELSLIGAKCSFKGNKTLSWTTHTIQHLFADQNYFVRETRQIALRVSLNDSTVSEQARTYEDRLGCYYEG